MRKRKRAVVAKKQFSYPGFSCGSAPEGMSLTNEGRIAIGEELFSLMSRNDAIRSESWNTAAGIPVTVARYY